MDNKNLLSRNNALYARLLPPEGRSSTVEGETLRAVNRIAYRYLNDGDFFHRGYGTETAGSAHAYLVDKSPIKDQLAPIFAKMVGASEKGYEKGIYAALKTVVTWIENQDGVYTVNDCDLWTCKSHFTNNDKFDDEDY